MGSPPISGTHQATKRFWNNFSNSLTYAGWINIRTGVAAAKWLPSKAYSVGDKIVPANDNGHYYTCLQSGTSGLTEPIFPVSANGQVSDVRGSNTWIANHFYNLNEIAIPSVDNGRFYICIQAGLSGTGEPTWSQSDGTTTYDGNATWRGYRIAKWQESGVAALFKPFGKME